MKTRILVVDDDPNVSEFVKDLLEEQGYSAVTANTTDKAMRLMDPLPALIVLDINLPGISGLKFCEWLRVEEVSRTIPILMLTGQSHEQDKVKGLEAGADDYIAKPFGNKEFVARVKALLRRADGDRGFAKKLEVKELLVDVERHEAAIKGRALDLRPKEFDLLVLFLSRRGRVLTRDMIVELVWRGESIVTSQTLAQHIKNLRLKLGPYSEYIETVETVGYKFKEF